jgi:hypothetical protein
MKDGRTQRDQPTGNSKEEVELVTKLLGNDDEEAENAESTATVEESSSTSNNKLNGSNPPVENSTGNINGPMVSEGQGKLNE